MKHQRSIIIILLGLLLIVISTTIPATLSTVNAAFSNGFENGFTDWSIMQGSPAPSIVTTPVYAGNNAMRCADPYSSQAIIIVSSTQSLYSEAKFRIDTSFVGTEALIGYFDPNGNPIATVGLSNLLGQSYATIEVYQPAYPEHIYLQYEITNQLQTNTWFTEGISFTSASCNLYFNDQLAQTISLNSNVQVGAVAIGMFYTSNPYAGNLYVDNVQIGTLVANPTPTSTLSPTATPHPTATPTGQPSPTPSPIPIHNGTASPIVLGAGIATTMLGALDYTIINRKRQL
jgi:hypothetical protein